MNHEEDYVWILLDKRGDIQGVYGNQDDAFKDLEYLGTSYSLEQWGIDYQTVAVEE